MRPNLCKPEIVNKCPEMQFTNKEPNKEMRRREGDKEEREGGKLIEEMRSHLCAAEDLSLGNFL